MGNYISCTLGNQQILKSPKAAQVILPTGDIKQIQKHPTKAAELMLDTPNHFIVNSRSLKVGRKFSPLHADDNLERANVYLLFPMHRKYSLVTDSDLDALFGTTNSTITGVSVRKGRVRPDSEGPKPEARVVAEALPRLSFEGVEEDSTNELFHRISISRSKKPSLETIDEEQASSRFDLVGGRFSI